MCFSPLQTTVSKYGTQFRGNSQHDALEFLLWLLDHVHEDVNLASHNNNNKTKPPGQVRIQQALGSRSSSRHNPASHKEKLPVSLIKKRSPIGTLCIIKVQTACLTDA